MTETLSTYDPAEDLGSDEAIATFVSEALATGSLNAVRVPYEEQTPRRQPDRSVRRAMDVQLRRKEGVMNQLA